MINMKKLDMIKSVYKILKIFEEESFDNYSNYLVHTAVLLADEVNDDNEAWLKKYISEIRGLTFFGNSMTHEEVRSIVLHITNGIDRNYKEV